jgi:hypothetical protein
MVESVQHRTSKEQMQLGDNKEQGPTEVPKEQMQAKKKQLSFFFLNVIPARPKTSQLSESAKTELQPPSRVTSCMWGCQNIPFSSSDCACTPTRGG